MNNFQAQWRQLVQESRSQWQENPRLRYALIVIPLILLLWLNLLLVDVGTDLQSREQKAYEQLSELSQESLRGDWVARLAEMKKAIDSQSSRFGKAENEALARADLQSKVAALVKEQGLSAANIEVSSAPAADKTLVLLPLQLRVSGRGAGDQLLALTQALAAASPMIKLDNLTVSNTGNELLYTLIVTAWYQPFGAGARS